MTPDILPLPTRTNSLCHCLKSDNLSIVNELKSLRCNLIIDVLKDTCIVMYEIIHSLSENKLPIAIKLR